MKGAVNMQELNTDKPVYLQLMEYIKADIITEYKPRQLLSQRISQATVNPNTMQRAFAELEQGGTGLFQPTTKQIYYF